MASKLDERTHETEGACNLKRVVKGLLIGIGAITVTATAIILVACLDSGDVAKDTFSR